ncbi:hypothetical protein [Caedibacter taeniospiralis]|nr:hypothetical protein [Caedibacter taeniospiralis]
MKEKRSIVESVNKQKYLLSDWLTEVTEENLQSEVDFGRELDNGKW